jgi:hypothetical protein
MCWETIYFPTDESNEEKIKQNKGGRADNVCPSKWSQFLAVLCGKRNSYELTLSNTFFHLLSFLFISTHADAADCRTDHKRHNTKTHNQKCI